MLVKANQTKSHLIHLNLIIFSEKQKKFLGFVSCSAGVVILGALLALIVYLLNLAFDLFGGVFGSYFQPLVYSNFRFQMLKVFFGRKARFQRIVYPGKFTSRPSLLFFLNVQKILHQTREIAGSVREWPTLLEEKAGDNLSADLWQGISSHVDAFKEY